MNDAARRLERELRRAQDSDRAMRRMIAELRDDTAELNVIFESMGLEPIPSFVLAEPPPAIPAAKRRVATIRA